MFVYNSKVASLKNSIKIQKCHLIFDYKIGTAVVLKIFRHAEYESARRDLNFVMGKKLELLVF